MWFVWFWLFATLGTKGHIHRIQRHKKLYQNMVRCLGFYFVWGHKCVLKDVHHFSWHFKFIDWAMKSKAQVAMIKVHAGFCPRFCHSGSSSCKYLNIWVTRKRTGQWVGGARIGRGRRRRTRRSGSTQCSDPSGCRCNSQWRRWTRRLRRQKITAKPSVRCA